ncbi:MAG TPA: hypothetical protein VGP55_11910 [Chitinophagaceae bacterium]|nr:hypothetical protein [Chitinophagaceae bacterium]
MKTILIFLFCFISFICSAQRKNYGGGHHTESHGGTFKGSVGSSHKGGHYKFSSTGNHYGRHRK